MRRYAILHRGKHLNNSINTNSFTAWLLQAQKEEKVQEKGWLWRRRCSKRHKGRRYSNYANNTIQKTYHHGRLAAPADDAEEDPEAMFADLKKKKKKKSKSLPVR